MVTLLIQAGLLHRCPAIMDLTTAYSFFQLLLFGCYNQKYYVLPMKTSICNVFPFLPHTIAEHLLHLSYLLQQGLINVECHHKLIVPAFWDQLKLTVIYLVLIYKANLTTWHLKQ